MPRLLDRLLKRSPFKKGASQLYVKLVDQARQPAFYTQGEVADTLDGRFDMISLHAVLLIRRIKRGAGDMEKAARDDLSQQVFDYMFDDMDRSLREMGVGDLTVGKRVKKMAAAFYGRATAYEAALDELASSQSSDALNAALVRNLYRDNAPSEQALELMVGYVRDCEQVLQGQELNNLGNGELHFAPFAPKAS